MQSRSYRFALIASLLSLRSYRFALIASLLSLRSYRFALIASLLLLKGYGVARGQSPDTSDQQGQNSGSSSTTRFSVEEISSTLNAAGSGVVIREVDSDVITDPPKKIQSDQFLIETGLAACANTGLAAFFNKANGIGQSPAVEPVYDLIELEVRNINIEREQRRVAGHVYGGSSSSTVDVVGSTEVLTELTDVQRESVEMPEVYSVLMSWTDVFGGRVRPMTEIRGLVSIR